MFEELLAYLDESNVRFVVGGGLAVVLQGYVASIEHLIRMKRAAGRPQDAVDIDQLEAIARRRRGH